MSAPDEPTPPTQEGSNPSLGYGTPCDNPANKLTTHTPTTTASSYSVTDYAVDPAVNPKDELMGDDDLEKLFTYQSPAIGMPEKFYRVAQACLLAARTIEQNCPRSAERTLAIRHLVSARMQANASISLRGQHLIP